MRKDLATLTLDQIEHELEWMEGCFQRYEQTGQGISTKETLWVRDLKAERGRRRASQRRDIQKVLDRHG
jgi:hypothetical protein